ncbi:MAG TPA: AI-2E family transporter, partial [Halomonas sp.]|nr:AI-2E family transporter [Halomonas sp.]
VSIIVAVLFFGGIWGFWGVFFAIPLATLLKALVYAWPRGLEGRQTSQVPPLKQD